MFFLLFFDTASELETPVAESLPQGKESYTPKVRNLILPLSQKYCTVSRKLKNDQL